MAILTTWEADRGGYFQGTPTPGELLDRFIDWARTNLGKPPKLPKLGPNRDHWSTWSEGDALAVTDDWLTDMIARGRLPSREQVEYRGNHAGLAQTRVMSRTHVFVEMLDTDRKTRHRCILLGTVLIASREGWEASLKAPV